MVKIKYYYYCIICGKTLKGLSQFYNHIKQHDLNNYSYKKLYWVFDNLYKCKICNKRLVSINKTYCSDKCKHSDKELNDRRRRKFNSDKTKQLRCKLCDKVIYDNLNTSGNVTKHLRDKHDIHNKNYIEYFILENKPIDKTELFHCPLCEWTSKDLTNSSGWFTVHLKEKHKLNIDKYVKLYPKHKYLWQTYFVNKEKRINILKDKNNNIQCEVCNKYFAKITSSHLKLHNLTISEYKNIYNVFNTCSKNVSNKQSIITTNHNLKHGTSFPNKISKLEINFENNLKNSNLKYETPFLYNGKKFDFYLKSINTIIEIDGIAYHPNKLENLTLQTLNI